jgi:hypothetical protein
MDDVGLNYDTVKPPAAWALWEVFRQRSDPFHSGCDWEADKDCDCKYCSILLEAKRVEHYREAPSDE